MDFLDGINTINWPIAGTEGVFKLLFLVIIFGYVIYSFLLTLRVRILNDTVKTSSNKTMLLLSYIHLLLAVVGGLFSVILILVG
ncbi:MAG: hypothetical protein UT34_C0001G0485 [candidate division WS6 bacterium GW2011_GWF2_39_15]|uniref:Uncharacterized protein n=1 Tax=candidate division WS6 bacterium GW2011_GWF2_39_15 TaxID=1619100 RepID=A0A0G0MQY6_9BACT|nr:MAG: hypothetical protein UT34_C0001G0485 [candidate division WS6 bacterium GW2011_GWF2_39_15]